jgi:hypothetical protein
VPCRLQRALTGHDDDDERALTGHGWQTALHCSNRPGLLLAACRQAAHTHTPVFLLYFAAKANGRSRSRRWFVSSKTHWYWMFIQ